MRLLHLNRTLDELDPPRWTPPAADATHLVRIVHELRRVPLGELSAADLRTLLSQQVALPYVLPLAVRLLIEEPLLDTYFYEGDLLLAAVNAPASAWALLPELSGPPCTPLPHPPAGLSFARRHRGFTDVRPPGPPLACCHRVEQRHLGFSPELRTPPLPATHVRAGTGHRTRTRGYPVVGDIAAPLSESAHSTHATSCRTCT
ncbi:contact-dependent growth inhibition system immunity protein [Streptomyces sp. NPDC058092]|uniref:contact-dependent growth inhibition system immunity protein n=1 Tax=Streptomyces sp. NPDC058092 TaxID=3346336 RepID=UPI0036EC6332